jgi:hypothetical protein
MHQSSVETLLINECKKLPIQHLFFDADAAANESSSQSVTPEPAKKESQNEDGLQEN